MTIKTLCRTLFSVGLSLFLSRFPSEAQNLGGNDGSSVLKHESIPANKLLADFYVQCSGGLIKHASLWTANNSIYGSDYYDGHLGMSLSADFHMSRFNELCYRIGIGYENEHLSYEKRLVFSDGVDIGWLTADLGVAYSIVVAGFKSACLISSRSSSPYGGIYHECFNGCSLTWYLGAQVPFSKARIEFKVGNYIIPPLNANRIAYYNMQKAHVNTLFLEFSISVRIFTTGNKYIPYKLI